MKLHYIDRRETKLCKAEIGERLNDMMLEDTSRLFVGDKKLKCAKPKGTIHSFLYVSPGRADMLVPRIHMTVLEKKEGCICNLYYGRTWGIWAMFIAWSLLIGVCIYGYASESNVFGLICTIAAYFLAIWVAKKHILSICKKVVNILEAELEFRENIF